MPRQPETVETQEGAVAVGPPPTPTIIGDVAYGNPLDALAALEAQRALENPVFRGEDWCELPNFYCPVCGFATLEGDAAVIAHGVFRHPGVNLKELVKNA